MDRKTSIELPLQRNFFYEAYKTKQDAVAHKETKHYLTWRDTVADWMTEPRHGVICQGLYPVVNI